MAVHNLNDNLKIQAPKPFDDKYGYWSVSEGKWKPYDSIDHALSILNEAYRYEGQTVPVMVEGEQVEYWFKGGVADEDFVLKVQQGAAVVEDDAVSFGMTSAQLDDLYPGVKPGFAVWSEANQIVFTKLDEGKWDYKSLSIA